LLPVVSIFACENPHSVALGLAIIDLSNHLNYNNNLLTDDTQYTDLLSGENFGRQTATSMPLVN